MLTVEKIRVCQEGTIAVVNYVLISGTIDLTVLFEFVF
jgi:hypothetical protein